MGGRSGRSPGALPSDWDDKQGNSHAGTTPTASVRSSRTSICTCSARAATGTPTVSSAPMRTRSTGQTGYFSPYGPRTRERVSVVGDFNGWDGRLHPMRVRGGSGVWELFIPDIEPAAITSSRSATRRQHPGKDRPLRQAFQKRPETAGMICAESSFQWQDSAWMEARAEPTGSTAHVRVRGTPGLLAQGCRRAVPRIPGAGGAAGGVRAGAGLHPHRAAARHRASARRLLGLSDHRATSRPPAASAARTTSAGSSTTCTARASG